MNDLFTINQEVHYLPQCGCENCICERARRTQEHVTSKHIPPNRDRHVILVPVGAAYLLNLIKSRSPFGSRARELLSRVSTSGASA